MNQRIDFSNNGGFPATQDTFAFMQQSYRGAFAALAGFFGDKVVVSGCVEAGGSVSDGWIAVGGELIPFEGGPIASNIIIQETSEAVTFEDNAERPVYFRRIARFGSPGGFPYSELRRPGEYGRIWLPGDTKFVLCTLVYLEANFDGTGLGINERRGWAICNGANGTQNMAGRMAIGYQPGQTELLQALGNRNITLEKAQLPAVQIDVPVPQNATATTDGGYGFFAMGSGDKEPTGGPTLKTANLGNGASIDILNPARVGLYIQKL